MSLLVVYEDCYYSEIDRALRRVVRRDGVLTVPRECHSVKGVTNFRPFVGAEWRRFRDQGFPMKGKPRPKALLCIADADAVAVQLGVTARAQPYDDWITRAEDEFTRLLRSNTDRPEQVHGALLRWNLESTLIAAYDEPDAMQRLAGEEPVNTKRLDEFLHDCRPDPRTVEDAAFTDTFEGSQKCLMALQEGMQWRRLKKGDRRKDDALTWMTEHRLEKLVARVPDLGRIARRVREIALEMGE